MKKRVIACFFLVLTLFSFAPLSLAASRTFRVSGEVTMDQRGRTVVTWTDSANASPYTVKFQCVNGSAVQTIWRAAINVSSKSCTVPYLVPGKKYKIIVEDSAGLTASNTITVPRRTNLTSTRNRTETTQVMYKVDKYASDDQAKALKTISATAIEKNLKKGYVYGIKFTTKYKTNAKTKNVHTAIFALTAPNGYVQSSYSTDFTLPRVKGTWYYGFVCGDFFTYLLDATGYIPTGAYTFQIFLEGRLYYQYVFRVGN